ncbi:HD domain-containing protein [Amphritea sp. 2_MG-2023]|uniref:HD-GYP domain-containing protein n=1 Tax=Amphritea TaxID=515417 RepID=UPI001C0649F9|nr:MULTISPECIES: HD domain-containing phosphohydrolase [Amphritea]MBU2966788.1 HD domain-containing protein [Amphritea atlantica]MDO6420681.1 HD domain-containing protein [Amphritea sp. 2_MG-2023]
MSPAEKWTYQALENRTKALAIALGFRDRSTLEHSARVQTLALELGQAIGLSDVQLSALRISSKFHDIGKIGIPDRILMKPTKLDTDDWKVMQNHPAIGEQIVCSTELEGAEQTAHIIRHHHEHFDGGGYPDRIAGEDIPIGARIISIVDSYDAMAFTRPYHNGRSHADIIALINRESGSKHDPYLLRYFYRMIETSVNRIA